MKQLLSLSRRIPLTANPARLQRSPVASIRSFGSESKIVAEEPLGADALKILVQLNRHISKQVREEVDNKLAQKLESLATAKQVSELRFEMLERMAALELSTAEKIAALETSSAKDMGSLETRITRSQQSFQYSMMLAAAGLFSWGFYEGRQIRQDQAKAFKEFENRVDTKLDRLQAQLSSAGFVAPNADQGGHQDASPAAVSQPKPKQ